MFAIFIKMKNGIKFLFISVLVLILVFLPIFIDNPSQFFIGTLFSVSGIMFSIGWGLCHAPNTSTIKNRRIIDKIYKEFAILSNIFLLLFVIDFIVYVLIEYLPSTIEISDICINLDTFFTLIMIYTIIFYIYNVKEIRDYNKKIMGLPYREY